MNSYQELTKEQLVSKVNELSKLLQNAQDEKTKQLEEMSRTDFLTKINNRGILFERLGYETKRATRTKESLSIVMFNIDDLKQVNDRYGQQMGDKVLFEVAKIITSSVRVTDIVGRFGGDEFMIILPACATANALSVAEQIRESVELNIFEDELRITVSGGIHQFTGETVDLCIDAAEKMVHLAKQNGQNRIETSSE